MILFFDTSALIKFFHEEEGTEAVTGLIHNEENEIWISEVAGVEFLSALYRRFRNNEINQNELEITISAFDEQFMSFNIEPFGDVTINEAKILLKKYGKTKGLRTLDAFQLGAFTLICDEDWSFVTSDTRLCNIAEQIGLRTINPLKQS
jgi:predicted nucleic acid-binding protein